MVKVIFASIICLIGFICTWAGFQNNSYRYRLKRKHQAKVNMFRHCASKDDWRIINE